MNMPLLNVSIGCNTCRMAFITASAVGTTQLSRPGDDTCRFRKMGLPSGYVRGRLSVTCLAAKKKGAGGSRRAKKQALSNSQQSPQSPSSSENIPPTILSSEAEKLENNASTEMTKEGSQTDAVGPLAPELLPSDEDNSVAPSTDALQFISDNSEPLESLVEDDELDEKQVINEVGNSNKDKGIKLPDLKANSSTIKRKRDRKRTRQQREAEEAREATPKIKYSLNSVRDLTRAYRLGGEGDETRRKLIDEMEREPDFILQASASASDYDLTSAIFGTGKPNKQGVYILPYLQSAHIVLLAIGLLVSFIYYPGFPLTEASDDVRATFKTTLLVVFGINTVLASLAAKAAKKRNQPPPFWALKTFVLGELAYGELRRNTNVDNSTDKQKRKK